MSKNVLIAYFSFSENTKRIAEKINETIAGDMFRIETLDEYPKDYNETAYGIAKEQHEKRIIPELKTKINISKYDVVFVGTPVWWYEMAPAVKSFLINNDFTGKTIVPFITHGGGGEYGIVQEMRELTKTEILQPFVMFENGNKNTASELKNWLNNLNI